MSKLKNVQVGKNPTALRFFVYGVEGVGKSSLAADSERPIFLDLEEGTELIDNHCYPIWEDDNGRTKDSIALGDVYAAVTDLATGTHDYKTLWIDGLEVLEALVFGEVVMTSAQRAGKKWANIEEVGGGYHKGYTVAVDEWRRLLSVLDRLRRTGMNIGFLGHARLGKRKDPTGVDWDCWMPTIHEKAWQLIAAWVELMAFCAHEEGGTKSEKSGRGKGWETGKRFIYTRRTATHVAKRRFDLPDSLELTRKQPWSRIQAAINALRLPGEPQMSETQYRVAINDELNRLNDEKRAAAVLEAIADTDITTLQEALAGLKGMQ